MDAVFIDINGNKKNFLYQYDKGQYLVIENFEYSIAPKVQFQVKSIETALSVQSTITDGALKVGIPNVLLTYGEDIATHLYIEDNEKGYVVETIFISVCPRKRPANYVYATEMFARTINGTTISENEGFTDVFEWADGNSTEQYRHGYFVNIASRTTIEKSTSINDVYGVTVNDTGFASNCTEDKLDKNGYLLPKYAYVCSSGFALVRDDGTCTVGGVCVPNSSGIATKSSNSAGFKVLARVNSNYIYIFVNTSIAVVSSHITSKSNPHGITKSQIGLGNVPNVTTNNQTPTYTETSILSPLTSGERLSIAFGKISKAITDFIAHVSDKNNPHVVTKSQVGLGNVDDTSDAAKPISTATQSALDAKAPLDDFNKLKERVDNLNISAEFVMTDKTTGLKYTLGVDNGKLQLILVE